MSDALLAYASALRAHLGAGRSRSFAVLSTLAFASIVAVAAYGLFAVYRELTDSALSRRASLSDLTAATLAEKFNRAADVGVSLATRVRFRDLIEAGEWATAARILRDAPADFEFIERIGLIDLQGALLAGVPEVPTPGRQNFADRDWFQAARDGKLHVSPIFKRAAPPQQNVFVVAVPIRSTKGGQLGVLVLQMPVAKFFAWIRTIDVGQDALIYVVDPRGALAYHPTLPLQGDLVDFSSVPVVRQALQGNRGVERSFNPVENEERISAYAPVPAYRWGVVVAEPAAAVFETRNRLLWLALFAYLLIFAFFAAFVANRVALQRERAGEERRVIAERERHANNALAQHTERLRILLEIDRAIAASASPQEVAGAAIRPLRELLGVPRAIVNLFDFQTGRVEWLAAAGRRRTHVGPGVSYSMRLMGDIEGLKRGEPQLIDTYALPPGPEVEALLASGVHAYMAVPMIAGGNLIGALSFGGEKRSFDAEQVAIVQEVATQLAIAITQSRLYDRIKRQADELEQRVAERTAELDSANRALRDSEQEVRMLQEVTLAISEAEGSNEALAVLLRKVCEYFNWSFAQAWLPDDGQNQLVLGAAWYSGIAELSAFRKANESLGFAPSGGVLEQVWRSKRPGWDWELKPLPAAIRRPMMLEAGLKSWLGVPVLADGAVIAVIEFFDYEQHQRDEGVLQLISILTTQLGPVIQRKRAIEQIATLNSSLKLHAAELEAANGELEAFSYSVSHDLRAPLRAVDGYALMLQEDYAKQMDDEGRRLLGVVREEARRMGLLIDDLLRLSQVGRKLLAVAPVDMRALATEAISELSPAYPKVRVELRDLPAATGDRALLKHVWMNLIGNALKYSAPSNAPRVEIAGAARGSENVYTVHDNGAGFDMRYYEKLFNVFQRLHRADEFEGTGVGLAIVQRVVVRHGGRVWAEGVVGKGASFHFALPTGG